ncbi:MAG: L-serine ammonia-lyase, iron-sulfur-dependent, subunit alpha [Clostridia bacterium]|nr:L-serine ammonia-lyase, iron-sulfur-dependent, subunit alpha [Clostridia bacterium]
MKSVKTVLKVGHGPSSSHTVGPYIAAQEMQKRFPGADFDVTLYGSLAFTGHGHGTGQAVSDVMPKANIIYDVTTKDLPHPNTMLFVAKKDGKEIGRARVFSIGGGTIEIEGEGILGGEEVYPEKSLSEILDKCEKMCLTLPEFVYEREGSEVKENLTLAWETMQKCIEAGLSTEGILPGGLDLARKAKRLFTTVSHNESADITMERLIASFSYAVCEENASGNIVVTAPTCGASGVIPSIMYYMKNYKGFSEDEIIDALCVAALVGNVIRTNASISGAECGCQAEVGSACSMAAAAVAHLYGLNLRQIEYAAEVAMEHNLGLTCDPVMGLVQIPCIERNAVAAMRALNAVNLSRFLYGTRRISFDDVIATMYRTGLDMNEKYRETSHGGLAQLYK